MNACGNVGRFLADSVKLFSTMTDFESKLSEVSPHKRRILQCLAIFWEPLTAQEFGSLIKILDLKNSENRGYSVQYLSLLRNSLVHQGILRNIKEFWGSGFQIFDENLKERLTREAAAENWFAETVAAIRTNFNLSVYASWSYGGERYKMRLLRDYRLSIYRRESEKTAALRQLIKEENLTAQAAEIVGRIFTAPFQKEFLGTFEPEFQTEILPQLFARTVENSESTRELWDFVREYQIEDAAVQNFEIDELIYKGENAAAKNLIGEPQNFQQLTASGVIAAFEADYETAVSYFEAAVKLWRKSLNKKKGLPDVWQMFVYGLALYKTDEIKFYRFAEDFYVYGLKNYPDSAIFRAVKTLEYFLKNNDNFVVLEIGRIKFRNFSDKIVGCLLSAIVPSLKLPGFTREFLAKNQTLNYRRLELELVNLLSLKGKPESREVIQYKSRVEQLQTELGSAPLGNAVPPFEDWERVLKMLTVVAETAHGEKESDAKTDATRIAWQLDFEQEKIQPIEQKYGKTGWTNGRNIALKRLFERDVQNMIAQDAAVVKKSMTRHRDYAYYGGDDYGFKWQEATAALIGHPHLFLLENPSVSVQLTKGEPALIVREVKDNLEISLDTKVSGAGFLIQKETESRYKVVEVTKQHVEIANSLQNGKLKIPAKGRESLMKAIRLLSTKIAIESDLEEHFENLPQVAAENRIHALITPSGDSFHLEFFVKPFGTMPPYFKPGKGHESVIADLDGVRTRTKRDLKNERRLLDEIEESCPFLAEFESQNYEWMLDDAEACLTAMSEMEIVRQAGKLVVEWTKGEKLKLLGNVGFADLSMSVKGKNNWFEVEGEIKVGEDLVLSMRELTGLLNQNTRNFIELSDGQFMAITEKLRKHLQSLGAVLDDKNRLHNLRSGILEELSGELENFKADQAWTEHLAKMRAAQKFVPELPATFEAELRPYQTDGYFWLSRLANWGVGACLADDMGLGKTIMALALLVERAERGAALVVAPVSVCRNWIKEAQRFAPTLRNFRFSAAATAVQPSKISENTTCWSRVTIFCRRKKNFSPIEILRR